MSIKSKRISTIRKRIWTGFTCWCFLQLFTFCSGDQPARAQRIEFMYHSYGLENEGDNVIQNAGHLDRFYESLYQLKMMDDRKISIVHLGDSHTQADFLTSIVRRNFHRHFGNAGRGLIVPLRVAGTNEPINFKTVSNSTWKSKRCVFPRQPLPIGIGGVTINTSQPEADLEIYMNDLWLDYSFNALTLFYQKDHKSFDFSVRDGSGNELGRIETDYQDSSRNYSQVAWQSKINSVTIQSLKSAPEQDHATIFGVMLENSNNGILYHTIGVNGAKFTHYNEARHFTEQTSALKTDLFIISLGTNESIDYPFLDSDLPSHIDKLVSGLRENNPMASFILVTPQEAFRNKNRRNPGILTIRNQIIDYAVENGLAFYDKYRALGGENSANDWTQCTLLRSDGIHLTKEGYEYQGNLLYHALMKGYNSYVPTRHP